MALVTLPPAKPVKRVTFSSIYIKSKPIICILNSLASTKMENILLVLQPALDATRHEDVDFWGSLR